MSVVERKLRVVVFTLMLLVSVAYTLEALQFHRLARYAPLFTGSLGVILFAVISVREVVQLAKVARGEKTTVNRSMEYSESGSVTRQGLLDALKYAAWFVGFVVLIWLVGMRIAAPIFVGVFMLADRETGWRTALFSVVGTIAFIIIFTRVGLVWYPGNLINF